ncbi:uncharacterized protein TNCV_850381 [Trichonephila clavipes]|uniref:Uncharacterized protein n=1 Tax=Trichonephila clavipes TaxID=2585209 RepID=A0A8X6VCT9_TRICX|nr:uncharacterized protein TNCV_850381 [Trichonephila clavipes]
MKLCLVHMCLNGTRGFLGGRVSAEDAEPAGPSSIVLHRNANVTLNSVVQQLMWAKAFCAQLSIATLRDQSYTEFWKFVPTSNFSKFTRFGCKFCSTNTNCGCGSLVVKISGHSLRVMSSSPVPLKTRRVGERCTLNLSRAHASRWCGSLESGVPAQLSSSSFDYGSKLRGPSPKALV